MMWYFIESTWDGKRMLVQIPYRSQQEAEQAAIRGTTSGTYQILSFPTRDKREVLRQWKLQQGVYP